MEAENILFTISKTLLASLELEHTLPQTANYVIDHLKNVEGCLIYCFSTSKGQLDLSAVAGGAVLDQIDDLSTNFFLDETHSIHFSTLENYELAMIRLLGAGFSVGVACFIGRELKKDQKLLQQISDAIANAVHNGISYRNLITERNLYDQFTRETRELYQLTKSLSTAFEPTDVITQLLNGVADIFKAQAHGLLLAKDRLGKLYLNFNTHFDLASLNVLKKKVGRTWQVLHESPVDEIEYHIINIPSINMNTKGLQIRDETQVHSWISAPLLSGDQTFGLLCAASSKEGLFRDYHLEMIYIVAGLAAKVIENAQLNEQLKTLATIDGLTGVYNHRTFQERLEDLFSVARRYKTPLSLLLMDIDYFKKFNDTYGHQIGDEVLKRVAKTIQNTMRDVDVVCRYGGEEFVVILPQTTARDGYKAAERLRREMESKPFILNNQELRITISLGVSNFPEGDQINREDLISQADAMLYKAKRAGRNKSVLWGSEESGAIE